MLCPIRIPDVLQNRIDKAAGKRGRSKWILDACRMRLDGSAIDAPKTSGVDPHWSHDVVDSTTWSFSSEGKPNVEFGTPLSRNPTSAETVEALRDICAGKPTVLPPHVVEAYGAQEVPLCGKTWWEDGEQWECLMDAGHRETKHGMRGMVRKLDA